MSLLLQRPKKKKPINPKMMKLKEKEVMLHHNDSIKKPFEHKKYIRYQNEQMSTMSIAPVIK